MKVVPAVHLGWTAITVCRVLTIGADICCMVYLFILNSFRHSVGAGIAAVRQVL